MIVVREAGGPANLGAIVVRDAVGASNIGVAMARDGAGLQMVFSASSGMSIDVPPEVFGAAAFFEPVGVTTSAATATITGGQAPYTYLWARTDGGGGTWQILSQGQATTAFRRLAVGPGESETATFTCTVTDSLGGSEVSANVDATASNFGSLGG